MSTAIARRLYTAFRSKRRGTVSSADPKRAEKECLIDQDLTRLREGFWIARHTGLWRSPAPQEGWCAPLGCTVREQIPDPLTDRIMERRVALAA